MLVEAPVVSTQAPEITSIEEAVVPMPEGCTLSKISNPLALSVKFPVFVPYDGGLEDNVQTWLDSIAFNESWRVFVYAANSRLGRFCQFLHKPTDNKSWISAGDAYREFLEQNATYVSLNGLVKVELKNLRPVQNLDTGLECNSSLPVETETPEVGYDYQI